MAKALFAKSRPFKGSRGTIFEVQFDGCDEVPCEVHHGETVHGRLQFESDVAADTLTCKLYAIIGGVEVEFPGGCPRVDACADLNEGDCPIEVGEYFEYEMTMYIDPSFPTTEVIGKWTLKDEASENVVCFTIPIDINP